MPARFSPVLVQRAHRWLGLLFSLTVLMSASSGILHILMSRTQAPPPPARPSGQPLDATRVTLPLSQAISSLPPTAGPAQAVNLRQIDGEPWYQIYSSGNEPPAYVNATTGQLDPSKDELYALQIAQESAGTATPIKRTNYLTDFDSEYINIFRILPVYRFDADDGKGTRMYVSTTTGSVTRHTDNARQFEASVFSLLHKGMFIPNKNCRDTVMVAVTAGIAAVATLGVLLFFLTGPKRTFKQPRVSPPANPSPATQAVNGPAPFDDFSQEKPITNPPPLR